MSFDIKTEAPAGHVGGLYQFGDGMLVLRLYDAATKKVGTRPDNFEPKPDTSLHLYLTRSAESGPKQYTPVDLEKK